VKPATGERNELTWDRFAEAVLTRLAPAHFALACSGHSWSQFARPSHGTGGKGDHR